MKRNRLFLTIIIAILLTIVFITAALFLSNHNFEAVNPSANRKNLLYPQAESAISDKPTLHNLAVDIDSWDQSTNSAGDLFFHKAILFEDSYIKNTKVFAEFGEYEHSKTNPTKSIEYWFFVKPGTKVRAASGGIIRTSYIDHTDDWGVTISPRSESSWFVSQEHMVNLTVSDGDVVKAGDIIGDASPHTSFGANLAFTELSVAKGGEGIIKYCPFDFLDEAVKPLYQEKLYQLVSDWEQFTEKNIYAENDWIAPGCLDSVITER